MPKAKKFIDRKNAVTFHLVHRSQHDPLVADEKAPQRVLLQAGEKQKKSDKEKRIDEQHKFGIFFDDDYNYMQHLRDSDTVRNVSWEQEPSSNNKTSAHKKADNTDLESVQSVQKTSTLTLPSSVFASDIEEKVGLLNKAAPQSGLRLDLDPDIVMAMDEDFDYDDPENQLDDNFMELANMENEDGDYSDGDDSEEGVSSDMEDYSSEERDEVASLDGPQFSFLDEETKSRFTEYSLSSSVLRRNDQLSLIDEKFEQMYSGYDDQEIGALDDNSEEDEPKPTTNDILLQYAKEFEESQQNQQFVHKAVDFKTKILQLNNKMFNEGERLVSYDVPKKEMWDCESILSTRSNYRNQPTVIPEPKKPPKIKINPKTGIPADVLHKKNTLTSKALAHLDAENNTSRSKGPESCAESVLSRISMLSLRPKDEKPADRKVRKSQLKECRRERRVEKKINIEAFKEEKKRQEKILVNRRSNVQGIK